MSLYYEAAEFLGFSHAGIGPSNGSLKSRIYGQKTCRNKPAYLYALASEATKWSQVLSPIIERVGLLVEERKLTPAVALLLFHDLLLRKDGIAAPKDHVLRKAIERHRARLKSEFTKARVKAGFATVEAWATSLTAQLDLQSAQENDSGGTAIFHPRWVRINTLKTTLDEECDSGFLQGNRKLERLSGPGKERQTLIKDPNTYVEDQHVANLIAMSPARNLLATQAYKDGKIILQDKASCFPATLLDPLTTAAGGDIIDACAAPGNKTTHLAALVSQTNRGLRRKIFAIERDVDRAKTLTAMVTKAGAEGLVEVLEGQDFLKLRPDDARFVNVTSMLLDPSCSGSGIIGRDGEHNNTHGQLILPRKSIMSENKSKNATREGKAGSKKNTNGDVQTNPSDSGAYNETALHERLKRLQTFQVAALKHAMSFPQCSRIVYSTCSQYVTENEEVVARALAAQIDVSKANWKPLAREAQVKPMRDWPRRGQEHVGDASSDEVRGLDLTNEIACMIPAACIRAAKGTDEGTMGFFTCGLERTPQEIKIGAGRDVDTAEDVYTSEETEWQGFLDD